MGSRSDPRRIRQDHIAAAYSKSTNLPIEHFPFLRFLIPDSPATLIFPPRVSPRSTELPVHVVPPPSPHLPTSSSFPHSRNTVSLLLDVHGLIRPLHPSSHIERHPPPHSPITSRSALYPTSLSLTNFPGDLGPTTLASLHTTSFSYWSSPVIVYYYPTLSHPHAPRHRTCPL
jgi:hypothetical protein